MLLVLLSFHTKAWYTFQLQLQKQIPNQELESVVLVSSCYIANYSKIQWLETNKNYYLAAPVSQEFGSGLAQELWLGVCRKFTVMMLAGVAVILKVDWIRRNHFQQGSCTWLLVAGLHSSAHGPLQRAAWTSSQHGKTGFFQNKWSRRAKCKPQFFFF